jgi:hypothetical protein
MKGKMASERSRAKLAHNSVAPPDETAEREISPAARKFAEALARRYAPKLKAGKP